MPRIRAIKPEFWSSPQLPSDPWSRLLYIAMWNWADDNGIGTAGVREMLGFAFPNDDHIGPADIRRMYGGIRRDFGVMFYTVGGRPYYSIPSWREHQKFDNRAKGRNPGPELAETWLYQDEQDDTAGPAVVPPQVRRDVVVGTGEPGNRVTGETPSGASELAPTDAPAAPPEQTVTANAYERVGKAFNFMAVRGIAKWAIHTRETDPQVVEDALVAIYEMGKPITKQLVGQYLDGHLGRPSRPGVSRADDKVQNYLETGQRLIHARKELA